MAHSQYKLMLLTGCVPNGNGEPIEAIHNPKINRWWMLLFHFAFSWNHTESTPMSSFELKYSKWGIKRHPICGLIYKQRIKLSMQAKTQ